MNMNRNRRRRPPQPPACDCQPRWLLPRVLGAARERFRCMDACLRVEGIPRCACGPFAIESVEAACEEARVIGGPPCGCGPSAACVDVVIPLNVSVCDGCGRRYCGTSELCVRVRAPVCACAPGGSLMALAGVRLVGACCSACEPVFDVRLEVWVDVYMVRLEPCGRRAPECPPP